MFVSFIPILIFYCFYWWIPAIPVYSWTTLMVYLDTHVLSRCPNLSFLSLCTISTDLTSIASVTCLALNKQWKVIQNVSEVITLNINPVPYFASISNIVDDEFAVPVTNNGSEALEIIKPNQTVVLYMKIRATDLASTKVGQNQTWCNMTFANLLQVVETTWTKLVDKMMRYY